MKRLLPLLCLATAIAAANAEAGELGRIRDETGLAFQPGSANVISRGEAQKTLGGMTGARKRAAVRLDSHKKLCLNNVELSRCAEGA